MVKNQHYVPRFYLKHFLNEQGKFWAFQKDSQKSFLTNPQSIANEHLFYDVPVLDTSLAIAQPVERYLSEIEAIHAPFLDYLIKGIDSREIAKINEDIHALLCDFLMFQIIRTKGYREQMYQGFTLFKSKLIESGWFNQQQITAMNAVNTRNDVAKSHWEQLLLDTDFKMSIISILEKHICLIFKNTTAIPYFTSDHPVVKVAHINEPHRSNTGLKSKGIEIVIPLSSTHLLVMLERSHFKHYEQYKNEVLIQSDVQTVIYYNALQVSQSYRTILCIENNFELAQEMTTTHPELRQLDHSRFGAA